MIRENSNEISENRAKRLKIPLRVFQIKKGAYGPVRGVRGGPGGTFGSPSQQVVKKITSYSRVPRGLKRPEQVVWDSGDLWGSRNLNFPGFFDFPRDGDIIF
jgi:hypothetical protein